MASHRYAQIVVLTYAVVTGNAWRFARCQQGRFVDMSDIRDLESCGLTTYALTKGVKRLCVRCISVFKLSILLTEDLLVSFNLTKAERISGVVRIKAV